MENSNKNNTVVAAYIAIAAFVVLVGAATYAYFSASQNIQSNIGLEVNVTGESYAFLARSAGNIDLNITPAMMDQAVSSESTPAMQDSANIIIELSSPDNNTNTTCSYDIVWQWTSSSVYTSQTPTGGKTKVSPSSGVTKELTVLLDGAGETNIASKTFISGTNNFIIGSKSTTASSTTVTTKTHVVQARFYNWPLNQDGLKNKNFAATITVQNVSCSMSPKS